jgi:MFS family permease
MDTPLQSVAFRAHRWWAVANVAAAQVLAVADACVVNAAVPSIRAGLHAGAAEIQAVVAVYQIAYAALAITGGRTGVGRKRVFIAGVISFFVASLWCGLSGPAPMLIFARAAQGGALALMVPQVLATIHTLYLDGARARAFAAAWLAT